VAVVGTREVAGVGEVAAGVAVAGTSEIFDFKNAVTLKTTLGVRQGHWKYHHSIKRIRRPIDVL